jgi:hypothetical protein
VSRSAPSANGTPGQRIVRLRSLYDCADMCGRSRADDGRMQDRAACRCSLPGFDSARWDPAASPDAAAQAEALADELRVLAEVQGVSSDFDLDRDGCPWGWVVSRFANSVMEYAGRRDFDSVRRDQNPRLWLREPKPDRRLLDWIRYAETVEDGAFSYGAKVAAS